MSYNKLDIRLPFILLYMKLRGYNAAQRYTTKLKHRGFDIGDGAIIYTNVLLDKTDKSLISIGKNCVLTGCTVLSHDDSTKYTTGERSFASVKIEDNCFIGWQSIILKGVTIGRGSVVGAGAVVTKNIPPYSIVVGNPAKIIKKLK